MLAAIKQKIFGVGNHSKLQEYVGTLFQNIPILQEGHLQIFTENYLNKQES